MYREIIEGPEFLKQAKVFIDSVARWDEMARGVTWAISLGAEQFPIALDDPHIRVAKIRRVGTNPPLRVFFTFDEVQAVLRWVEEMPISEIEDEEE